MTTAISHADQSAANISIHRLLFFFTTRPYNKSKREMSDDGVTDPFRQRLYFQCCGPPCVHVYRFSLALSTASINHTISGSVMTLSRFRGGGGDGGVVCWCSGRVFGRVHMAPELP
jgi:hypothetical protein